LALRVRLRTASVRVMAPPLNRTELFADRSLVGTVFCRAYSRRVDEFFQALYAEHVGNDERLALVAVGGYGRARLFPQSDLDVMLVHNGVGEAELTSISEKLWYPIWDEGLKLGHSVRTIREAVELGATDLDTATALTNIRALAGDEELIDRLAEKTEHDWVKNHRKWLPELADGARERRRNGEVAFLLEPDVKDGFGGLRDIDAIRWAQSAGMTLLEQEEHELRAANEVLLAARVELHRVTERPSNRLLLEDQDEVAEALGIGDADVMMRQITNAARTVVWIGDDLWNRVRRMGKRKRLLRWIRPRVRKVAPGVTLEDGTIALGEDAHPGRDPELVFRVAAQAALHEARIDRDTLDRLANESAPLPTPWPDRSRMLFTDMLQTGHRAIPVIEALDHTGTWGRLIPEWKPNRNRPQRNAYHRFTVDRHLTETVAEAAERLDWVDRPDLLVLGALLHDIGKGYPGDHSIVGMDLVDTITTRMGFPREDVATLVTMVQHHLLLPDAATRLDIEDPGTVAMVAEHCGTPEVARLLGALTAADSIATGPSAWSKWKAGLVRELVERVDKHLKGDDGSDFASRFPTEEQRELIRRGETVIVGQGNTVTIVLPDAPGLISKVAGALSASRLDVVHAAVHSENGFALQHLLVEDPLGNDIDWARVEADLGLASEGRLEIEERIAARIASYGLGPQQAPSPIVTTYVEFNKDVADQHTVVEVGAPDQVGLLYRITRAITEQGFTIDQARVQSLGDHVVDTFYVRDQNGRKVKDAERLDRLSEAILAAVAAQI